MQPPRAGQTRQAAAAEPIAQVNRHCTALHCTATALRLQHTTRCKTSGTQSATDSRWGGEGERDLQAGDDALLFHFLARLALLLLLEDVAVVPVSPQATPGALEHLGTH